MSTCRWAFAVAMLLATGSEPLSIAAEPASSNVICCGGAEVFVIDPEKPGEKVWTWRATDSPSIPEAFRPKFRSTDDCKPFAGDLLLVTSSSGGVVVLDRRTKRCRFLADCRNAHSACPLPDNRLVVRRATVATN